jgi:hypothetical protein
MTALACVAESEAERLPSISVSLQPSPNRPPPTWS